MRQDILANILLLSVKTTHNYVDKEQKNTAHQQDELNKKTIHMLNASRTSYKELVVQIERITKSTQPDTEKILEITQILDHQHEKQPVNESIEEEIKKNLEKLKKRDYYKILEEASVKLQNRVADIMRYLTFEAQSLRRSKVINQKGVLFHKRLLQIF